MIARFSRSQLIALVVASSQFMQNLDSSIVNTSLPQMASSFGVGPIDLSVSVTAYVLASAAFVPLSGWAAQRFGAKRVFALAVAIFTVASAGCGFAETLWQFILARALQGFGGALMVPVGQAIVVRNAQKHELISAMALITWPALLAPVIGPALGGWITTYTSWRWNFLLNLPLGVAAIALIMVVLPAEPARRGAPFDWRGFVLCSTALICLLEGLELMANAPNAWLCGALIGVGAVSGLLALRHLRTHPEPLLSLAPFEAATYRAATFGGGFLVRSVINSTPFLLPLMFQIGWGLSPAQAGLLLLLYFVGNVGIKPLTTPILRWLGFRTILIGNGVLVGVSLVVCAFLSPDTPMPVVGALLVGAGAVRSMQFTAQNTMMFADVATAHKASASTLSSMLQQTTVAVGVASAAFLVQSARAYRGGQEASVADFRVALCVLGLIAALGALRFRSLPPDAAAEVSRHRAYAGRGAGPR